MTDRKSYGWQWPETLRFPVWKVRPLSYYLGTTTPRDFNLDYEVNTMTRRIFVDGWDQLHRCYVCDRCKTVFLGTELWHFSHGCNEGIQEDR